MKLQFRAMVRCLAVGLLCATAHVAAVELQPGMPLAKALKTLQAEGVPLVFSDALVGAQATVEKAPQVNAPRAMLDEILAPHGLKAKAGPGETILVVKDKAGDAGTGVGVVSNILVLSDKVKDVSSLDAWKASYLREGMSDKEKALAAWKSCVTYQHQEAPPIEFTGTASQMDPIKIFNVYGYAMCNSASSNVENLSRAAGLKARGRIISSHSVPEVFFDDAWHLLDGSLICYFPKKDGQIASVNELIDGVTAWLKDHPELKGNNDKLYAYMKTKGWKTGPEILRQCAFYDERGWFPAATHGWYSTMQEYDVAKDQVYEYGVAMGYRVNVQLREGERLVRNWSNKGLHVNMHGGGGKPGCLNGEVGKGSLRYTPDYGDLAPGRVGNGTLAYDVPLASGAFRKGALVADNLLAKSEGAKDAEVAVKDAAKPGVLVLRMPSSYVYLQGKASFNAKVAAGGAIKVSLSRNHGLDWKELQSVTQSGAVGIDLSGEILRHYQYRIRFELSGAGTGLSELLLTHDIQHSQRPLPALAQGANTITFKSGPQEGTITIEGCTDKNVAQKHKVSHYSDFHPVIENLRDPMMFIEGGAGQVTFALETPGDLVRVRSGAHLRARDKRDGWDISLSYDGENFEKVHRWSGPTAGTSEWFGHDVKEKGKRKVWVRYSGTNHSATGLMNLRIDADYLEPNGGFAPVKVVYEWEENGEAKRQEHIARKAEDTFTITCGAKPVMKSITLERAP